MSETMIIAVISALVSLVVAFLTTSFKNRADLRRVYQEQEHGYAKALFEKRVEYYPELYNLLSGYAKVIRAKKQNIDNLNDFKQSVDEWNSKHSLFFTIPTARFSASFRFLLVSLLKADVARKYSTNDWERFRRLIGCFETLLKAEIGILVTKPVGDAQGYEEGRRLVKEMIAEAEKLQPGVDKL